MKKKKMVRTLIRVYEDGTCEGFVVPEHEDIEIVKFIDKGMSDHMRIDCFNTDEEAEYFLELCNANRIYIKDIKDYLKI